MLILQFSLSGPGQLINHPSHPPHSRHTNGQQSQSLYLIYSLSRAAISLTSECMGMHFKLRWTPPAKTVTLFEMHVCCCLSYNKAC